ncbi:Na(+)/H(+) antiporter subunit E1 [Jeotgalicoccus saudimassiliensis]|uniref:Na(+)/H(+) antiporter subunit E1 n=1 Tax=Jeotgalicoccus saudimassiliensis TaxID=1461582 RepID=A0A078M1B6_9STAP|nr:Na+/H+ antiporter subunit E [Jeotgalicoccus saudimassiliensis]CDZ99152.1 Na(+)/H(+) antiporter subunit E1 [Jeotgalicoccus saudimassiliensis]
MSFQLMINVLLAFLWVFMNGDFTVGTFVTGYLIGLVAVYVLRNFLPGRFYIKRLYWIIKLFFIFIIELTKANLEVVRIVMSPKIDIHPGFYAYPSDLEEEWEVALLSTLITLTPGTVVVAISEDYSNIYIHGLDMEDADEEIENIKTSFENVIKEVSKP